MTNLTGSNLNRREATGPKGEGRDSPSTFPKYSKYKESGVEWLGEVPAHWDVVKLKRLCHMQSGDFISPSDIEEEGTYPVYGGNGRRGFTSSYTHKGLYPIVGRQGALCGNVNYASGQFWASEHAVVVTPEAKISPIWLGEVLRSMDLNQYSITAAQPGLAVDKIKNLYTPCPPLDEQKFIAAFLDHETARIDALVEQQQRLIELLKEKRQAVISHAVTKGLDPDVPMKDSGVEWLGEVPAHWDKTYFKRIAKIKYGIGEPPKYQETGIPLIRATNVSGGEISKNSMVMVDPEDIPSGRVLWLRPGDLIIVRSGAYTGDSAIVGEVHLPAIAGFDMVASPRGCFPMFLQYVLLSKYFKDNQVDLEKLRAAQPHLNAEELGACFTLLPPPSEQVEISAFLDDETARIDALVEEGGLAIKLLQERRSALISAAVTGKIDVRGWQADQHAEQSEVLMAAEARPTYG